LIQPTVKYFEQLSKAVRLPISSSGLLARIGGLLSSDLFNSGTRNGSHLFVRICNVAIECRHCSFRITTEGGDGNPGICADLRFRIIERVHQGIQNMGRMLVHVINPQAGESDRCGGTHAGRWILKVMKN
jgi:hypothetical protein